MYSWAERGTNSEIYMEKNYNTYHKKTIFAVVTSKGDLLFMMSYNRANSCSF